MSPTLPQSICRATEAFNQPLSTWVVSSVTPFVWAFGGATAFNQDLSAWDVSAADQVSPRSLTRHTLLCRLVTLSCPYAVCPAWFPLDV